MTVRSAGAVPGCFDARATGSIFAVCLLAAVAAPLATRLILGDGFLVSAGAGPMESLLAATFAAGPGLFAFRVVGLFAPNLKRAPATLAFCLGWVALLALSLILFRARGLVNSASTALPQPPTLARTLAEAALAPAVAAILLLLSRVGEPRLRQSRPMPASMLATAGSAGWTAAGFAWFVLLLGTVAL